MTENKDFKRIVHARARRTGETYSSALRNVRNARPAGTHEEDRTIAITRTIPDIRSTRIQKTTRFYNELLGFDIREVNGQIIGFISSTNPSAEVTLNRDGFTLPPGFTVEVDSVNTLKALYDRRTGAKARTIEELDSNGAQLDSSPDPIGLPVRSAGRSPASPPMTRGRRGGSMSTSWAWSSCGIATASRCCGPRPRRRNRSS
ncbi:MAG: VOC family protein [Acidimicrobiales bacterium]